jgi:alanyl-tRNA synthetase
MTKRLFYLDSYLTEFSGNVVEERRLDGNPAVILDQTAFYPESGGQPCDTGTLEEARVLNVQEDDAGAILHILDRAIPGGRATGRIDWDRRFDHMQQHTGQHVLSQAFIAVAHAPTISFHLGQETSTIDVELAQPSPSHIEKAQALATKVAFENREVRVLATDRENLSSLGVRKDSRREGEIRVIEVEGFDRSMCGGTHVRRTGEIGVIAVLGFEHYKGGTRVEFAAGYRALKALSADHGLLKKLGKLYSASPNQLPDMTERLFLERAALSRENNRLREQLLEMEAAELVRGARRTERAVVVKKTYSGRDLEEIKVLARKVAACPGIVAILAIAEGGRIVLARSADLPGSCHEAVRRVIAEFGGKGGGRPELAQAGGLPAESLDSCLAALEGDFA